MLERIINRNIVSNVVFIVPDTKYFDNVIFKNGSNVTAIDDVYNLWECYAIPNCNKETDDEENIIHQSRKTDRIC